MSGPALEAAAIRRADLCSSTDRVSILMVTPGLAASNCEKICFNALSSATPFVRVQMISSSARAVVAAYVARTPATTSPFFNFPIISSCGFISRLSAELTDLFHGMHNGLGIEDAIDPAFPEDLRLRLLDRE